MNWKVPLFDTDYSQEEQEAVARVISSGWLTMGPETEAFEEEFAGYIGCKYALAVNNCTAALHLAHKVLGASSGCEVICPSLTFVATANSILYTGATPRFADIEGQDNLNISIAGIEELISKHTKGVVVVHYAGYPCDMDALLQLTSRHDLYVVEDSAHAPGASYNGQKVGSIGEIGCFSFFSNKNLSTGEGGMITTNDEELFKKLKLYRSHGMTTLTLDRHKGHAFSYDVIESGYNYRIDEIKAALGRVQLRKLDKKNARRRDITEFYRQHLSAIDGVHVPFTRETSISSHHIMPVLLPEGCERQKVMKQLAAEGIQSSIHYPPIHQFSHYRQNFPNQSESLSKTEAISARELTLPLYPAMSEDSILLVVSALRGAIHG